MKDGFPAMIKRAFKWHWNLLFLGAGVAFGLLSGRPDVALPALAAGELLYLGTLGVNPRFQKVLVGMKWTPPPAITGQDQNQRYNKLISFLERPDAARFAMLRDRCAALLELRRQMDTEGTDDTSGNAFRGDSLDRMLWLYLKLLHQKTGLARFLHSVNPDEIKAELATSESQLHQSETSDQTTGQESRLTTSIKDRIKTIRERIANHEKAQTSLDLAAAEIEKTEQQIIHLCEVGMTTRDSAGLSSRIDIISEGLRLSENTFSTPGLDGLLDDESAPAILSGSLGGTSQVEPGRRAMEG
jgi:hypothetical protein